MKGWGPGVANDADGKPRADDRQALQQAQGRRRRRRRSATTTTRRTSTTSSTPRRPDKPWCFWYGAIEPHRGYEFGSGVAKGGKKLTDIDRVPAYWPDNDTVRNDMLDYAFEVEHFDRHLGRMLAELEKRGLLENTLVIVTSDHGMPFPRSKGNAYALANHVPFAVMWKAGIAQPGRVIDDFVSFVDLAPTFIEVAGLKWARHRHGAIAGPQPHRYLSLRESRAGHPARDHVLIGKERTDVGRPHDWGYPIRGIVTRRTASSSAELRAHALARRQSRDRLPRLRRRRDEDLHPRRPSRKSRRPARGSSASACAPPRNSTISRPIPTASTISPRKPRPQPVARKSALREQLHAELSAQGDPRMDRRRRASSTNTRTPTRATSASTSASWRGKSSRPAGSTQPTTRSRPSPRRRSFPRSRRLPL